MSLYEHIVQSLTLTLGVIMFYKIKNQALLSLLFCYKITWKSTEQEKK